MTLFSITQTVRNAGGQILICGSTSFGYIVRASISGKPCRIITPTPDRSLKVLPLASGAQTHVITDAPSLQAWLLTVRNA